MADIRFDNVSKSYGARAAALLNFSLDIAQGEFMVFVGPSGCGKTTALRLIAGLEDITDGRIFLGDRELNDVPPRARDVAMVFQNYALYPHMTVAQNIGFPLRLRGLSSGERDRLIADTARLLGLTEYLDRRPRELSGGQRQRVAMGRAIIREPQAFLLDEPLSNLDAKLREEMRAEILALQQRVGVTTVYVTHDQVEAMTMGDRVVVIRRGALQQVDRPEVLYLKPCNLFVASFLGSPSMNFLMGQLRFGDEALAVIVAGQRLELPASTLERYPALQNRTSPEVVVGIRPSHLHEPKAGDVGQQISGVLRHVEKLGAETRGHVDLGPDVLLGETILAHMVDGDAHEAAEAQRRRGWTTVAVFQGDAVTNVGGRVQLVVESEHIHLFDPVTGLSLLEDETGSRATLPSDPVGDTGQAATRRQ